MLKISNSTSWFRDACQYFVNDEKIYNADAQYRARILAGCIIVFTVLAVALCIILAPQIAQDKIKPEGLFISLFLFVFFSFCLYFLKHSGNITFIANLTIVPVFISLIYSSMITGGPKATSNEIMILIPLILYFTAGAPSAFLWALLIFIAQTTLFIMHKNGYVFIQSMNTEAITDQAFTHWMITLVGLLGIARVYDKSHNALINQRDKREIDNQYLTTHDLLTGASNRQHLLISINNFIKSTKKHQQSFAIIIIDIQNLHHINLEHGFEKGDAILMQLSQRLLSLSSIKMVSRSNGNQFTVVTHPQAHLENSNQLIEELLETVNAPYTIDHRIVSLSIHLGISLYKNEKQTAESLFIHAEDSLRKARSHHLAYTDEP